MSDLQTLVSRQGRWAQSLILILIGALAALGQAPWGIWSLTLIAMAAAMCVIRGEMPGRTAFRRGWCLGLGYFAVSLHWIVEPFLVDVARHGWMAPFALVFMASGAAMFWGLGAVLARVLGRGRVSPLGLAFGLTAVEMLRSLILTGFPWALIGHVWIDTPLAQLAAFVGPHGLTLALLLLAASAAMIAASLWLVPLTAAFMAVWVVLDPAPATNSDDDAPVVRVIQPNAPQDQKWLPGFAEMFFERQLTQTALPGEVDLVVWPETSVPFYLNTATGALAQIANAARGAPVVVGGLRTDGQNYYNTMAVLDQTGGIVAQYDKSHLVPFGEYIPLNDFWAQFGIFGLASDGGYAAGGGLEVIDIPGFGSILPGICYEYIFAEEINIYDTRPAAMIFITNDAWFGNYAGPEQHLAQARLRAIEHGLPVIRSANTGISAVIDAQGRIVQSLALNTQGIIDVALPAVGPATIYHKTGDWGAALLLVLTGLVAALAGRKSIDPITPDA